MKTYLEHLSKDEIKKNEFETAVNNAMIDVAKKHGFDSIESEAKQYSNTQLGAYTVKVAWTGACCGQ